MKKLLLFTAFAFSTVLLFVTYLYMTEGDPEELPKTVTIQEVYIGEETDGLRRTSVVAASYVLSDKTYLRYNRKNNTWWRYGLRGLDLLTKGFEVQMKSDLDYRELNEGDKVLIGEDSFKKM